MFELEQKDKQEPKDIMSVSIILNPPKLMLALNELCREKNQNIDDAILAMIEHCLKDCGKL